VVVHGGPWVELAGDGAVAGAEEFDLAGAAGGDDPGEAVAGDPAVGAEAELVDGVAVVGLGPVVEPGQRDVVVVPGLPGSRDGRRATSSTSGGSTNES